LLVDFRDAGKSEGESVPVLFRRGKYQSLNSPVVAEPELNPEVPVAYPQASVELAPKTFVSQQQLGSSNAEMVLVNRVTRIRDWVRQQCPRRNYLEELKTAGVGVIVNDNAIIVHMYQIFGKNSLNPLSRNFGEDICVVVWNATPDAFDVVVVAFDSEDSCRSYVRYSWPDAFGVDDICSDMSGGWGHYLRVKFH
jgi:hypothetical protein